jgi:Ion channel
MRTGIWHLLSKTHPLTYLTIYLVLIVLYPLIYLQLDRGFYAPYVHFELSAEEDAYRAGQLVQSVWRQTLMERLKQSPVSINGLTVLPTDVSVQQFKISEDGTMHFNASIHWHRPGDGLVPTYFPVLLHADVVGLESASGYADQYSRAIYLGDTVTLDAAEAQLATATFKEIFKPVALIFGDYPRIAMRKADNASLEQFVEGYKGNPRLVSDSYFRMLYFSAIVMTTVGFGDIVPLTPMARLATGLQAVFGVALFGLFLNSIAYRAGQGK